jgi:zeaxanthin glucosyltransferase
MEDCFSPLLQIAQIVPGLDFPRKEIPTSFHYVGPFKREGAEAFQLPPSPSPTVYCTLGTLQGSRLRLLRKLARACHSEGLRLVITLGKIGDRRAAEALPGSPLVYDWVPQDAVLQQAHLVICHGGMNTVLDTLQAGLPMLVLPLAFDQPAIAARVQQSGAGRMLGPRSSDWSIAQALKVLRTDPSYRSRAQELGEEINRAGGTRLAADLIEQALGLSAPQGAATMAGGVPGDAHDDSRSGSRSEAKPAS